MIFSDSFAQVEARSDPMESLQNRVSSREKFASYLLIVHILRSTGTMRAKVRRKRYELANVRCKAGSKRSSGVDRVGVYLTTFRSEVKR